MVSLHLHIHEQRKATQLFEILSDCHVSFSIAIKCVVSFFIDSRNVQQSERIIFQSFAFVTSRH